MKKAPNFWILEDLVKSLTSIQTEINGIWVPARPIGFFSLSNRAKLAWQVFTGKCDAVRWPGGQ